MSIYLRKLRSADPRIKIKRAGILALAEPVVYDDGRTKQSFADEANIVKIMARADKAGTISHLQKFEGTYSDFSDFDFHTQETMLAKGATIFNELPAEVRKEFGQSPQAFFAFVNDSANKDKLGKLLPELAKPGKQMASAKPADADTEAAEAAAEKPLTNTTTEKVESKPDVTPDV